LFARADAKRAEALKLRVIEHNVLVVAKYYAEITTLRLSQLLDLNLDDVSGSWGQQWGQEDCGGCMCLWVMSTCRFLGYVSLGVMDWLLAVFVYCKAHKYTQACTLVCLLCTHLPYGWTHTHTNIHTHTHAHAHDADGEAPIRPRGVQGGVRQGGPAVRAGAVWQAAGEL